MFSGIYHRNVTQNSVVLVLLQFHVATILALLTELKQSKRRVALSE
jgi:hypothetical protein